MKTKHENFTFVDLFAGIGGMRLAFESAGGRCIFSSEWNRYAQKTYETNFGDVPVGDITKVNASDVPNHDILAAGFPCQPFSIAGVSKKQSLNRPHGFEDETQGTLFFDIARILAAKRPKAFLLENVKNLRGHDKGRTLKIILDILEKLGYHVFYKIIDAKAVVPQHRERIYIVGFSEPVDFEFPEIPQRKITLRDILEKNVDKKYTLTDGVWKALKRHAASSKAKGNGFGYGIADLDGISRTLSARYYKDGGEILISQGRGRNPRRLTPRECARLMGFPESFKIVVSDTQAYRQFGNSLVVQVAAEIAKAIVACMQEKKKIILNAA